MKLLALLSFTLTLVCWYAGHSGPAAIPALLTIMYIIGNFWMPEENNNTEKKI